MGTSVIKVASAKVIGRSHVSTDTPCQDAVATIRNHNAVCVALADGAGSKKHSEIGAKIATKQAAKAVLDNFDEIFLLANEDATLDSSNAANIVLDPILVALRRRSKSKRESLDSFASTLLFVAHKDGRYVAGHLGDGVIGIKHGAEIKTLSKPENGEFANSTYFVTDESAKKNFRIYAGIADSDFGAILMSDGTAETLYEKSTGLLALAAQRLFEWSEQLSSKRMEEVLFGNLQQVISKKTTDDCSIAMITVKD